MAITVENPVDRAAAYDTAYEAAFQEFSVSHNPYDAFAKASHAVIDLKVKIFEDDRVVGKGTRDAIAAIEKAKHDAARTAHRKGEL